MPLLPTTGWKNFPSACLPPGFCYGSINEHIISTATLTSLGQNASDSEEDSNITDFHTSKPMLKGRQFFNSGHVKNMKHQQKGSYQFFKCHVMASYSIQTIYNVTLTLHSQTGKVMDASCDCKASAMRRCNHVAALLFALEDYVIHYGQTVASTSQICTWNVGKKINVTLRHAQMLHIAKN